MRRPAGTSCTVGAAEPTPCLPGSFADQPETETCKLCQPGQYQDDSGQTACKACLPGRYCIEGAAAPTPCPGGTSSSATGAVSDATCTPVTEGFWAPLGSIEPEACTSGFFCPGKLQDEVHGGAKPRLMPVGGSTTTQEVDVVEKEVQHSALSSR